MKTKSVYVPTKVPVSFEQWKMKHFYNPELKPISYTNFRKRGKAPKLYLRHYNYDFNPKEAIEKENKIVFFIKELKEIPNNIKSDFNKYIAPLFYGIKTVSTKR